MPALSIPTNLAQVEAWAGALYGSAVGQTTMNQINSDIVSYGGLNNTLNAYYSSAFGSLTTAAVAASVVTNLGIVAGQNGLVAADVTQANLYVVGVLNGTAANARGVAIANVVSLFNGLAGTTGVLANFSAAATTWVGTVANSIAYNATNATDNTFTVATATVTTQAAAAVAAAAAAAAAALAIANAPKILTLTSGIDTFTGSAGGNNTFNRYDSVVGGVSQATFTAGDVLVGGGGTGNLLNWVTGSTINGAPAGVSVTGIQAANVTSSVAGSLSLNTTSGWTGLTSLAVTNSNSTAATANSLSVTANPTTSVTAIDSSQFSGTLAVNGAQGATVTANNLNTTAATIAVGTTTAIGNGPVSITSTSNSVGAAAATYAVGTIQVKGGSLVSVTQNIGPDSASRSTIQTGSVLSNDQGGNITITGTKDTTSVNVTQTGQTAAFSSATVGFAGVIDGTVTINDLNYLSPVTPGTITSVTLQNYQTNGASTIADSALTTLTLSSTGSYTKIAGTSAGSKSGSLTLTNPLATPTVSTLALNLGGGSLGVISGTLANAITTLNIVTTAATTAMWQSSGTKTINISGSGAATLGGLDSGAVQNVFSSATNSSLTALNVSGAAGFGDGNSSGKNQGLNSYGANLAITNTGTGIFTAAIDVTAQSYIAGAAGTSIITVTAEATKVITAGAGTADEIIFNSPVTLTAALSGANISGFEIFGVGPSATGGTFNLSRLGSNKFTTIDVTSDNTTGTYTFNNVTAGTGLNVVASSSTTVGNTVTYSTSDTNGPTDTLNVNIGSSSATSGTNTALYLTLTTLDATGTGGNGIGLLTFNNLVTTAPGYTTTLQNTVVLTDRGLTNLTVTGPSGLLLGGAMTIVSSSLTIADNSTSTNAAADGMTGAFTLTANTLSALNYSGTRSWGFSQITDTTTLMNITNANTGSTGVLTISTLDDATLANATIKGSVAIPASIALTTTTGLTFNGVTDNSAVVLATGTTAGAAATFTDSFTFGNGNNSIRDYSSAGTVSITVGTGQNSIIVGPLNGTATSSGSYTINLGSHGAYTATNGYAANDNITVASAGSYFASAANVTINGAQTGDIVQISGDTTAIGGVIVAVSGAPSNAAAISRLESTTVPVEQVGVAYVASSGQTLIYETSNATASASVSTLFQLTGQYVAAYVYQAAATGNEQIGLATSSGNAGGINFNQAKNLMSNLALGTHTAADTFTFTGGAFTTNSIAGNGAGAPSALNTSNIYGFNSTVDKIVLTGNNTFATVGTGATGGWNLSNAGIYIETGTYISGVGAVGTAIATALGNVTSAAAGVGTVAIQTGAATGIYELYQINFAAAHLGGGGIVVGDAISLIGQISVGANNTLTTANFTA